MRYVFFVLGFIFYSIFALDIENDRDFMTWGWLLLSVYFFINSIIRYYDDKSKTKSTDNNLEFTDISSEKWRKYYFKDYEVLIVYPKELNVSASGGHRVLDSEGTSHYIPTGWVHLEWKAKEGEPKFVR